MKATVVYALLALAALCLAATAILVGLHDTPPVWFEAGFFGALSAAAGVTIPQPIRPGVVIPMKPPDQAA